MGNNKKENLVNLSGREFFTNIRELYYKNNKDGQPMPHFSCYIIFRIC